ncbi:MAG: 4-alpha-glucanotransferase [Clostridia bacterium]|nr:4-alpha-glucanotransferase [Clostridia bacterium]
MFKRSSGVLMHISSLPGDYGIGSFGKDAKNFIDLLSEAGCTWWQVLPFGPTDIYNSPYASISAFAGNPNFIDLEGLKDEGLLTEEELLDQKYANPYTAAFEFLNIKRIPVLYKAFTRIDDEYREKVKAFAEDNKFWLPDYALYMILKEANLGDEWFDWKDEKVKLHDEETVAALMVEHEETILFMEFIQYVFYKQWAEVKSYANEKNVKIIGDLPMYVARQSSDVWSNRNLFDLAEDGEPKCVAGVPPDYFSALGQKWGNPLYDWKAMKEDGYNWWLERLNSSFTLFDAVRIDHFRAFSAYWAVPFEAETAIEGEWRPGPGMDFFKVVIDKFGGDRIIAEDLGIIDDGVVKLIEDTGFPCMRVMQFAFDFSDNMHLPHNMPRNAVAYTGTHDNNTTLGWLWEATPEQKKFALDYCDFKGNDWAEGGWKSESVRSFVRTLWSSPANMCIVPIQDLCGFGSDTKMNIPGVPNGNWAYRISREHLGNIDFEWVKKLNKIYFRTAEVKKEETEEITDTETVETAEKDV